MEIHFERNFSILMGSKVIFYKVKNFHNAVGMPA